MPDNSFAEPDVVFLPRQVRRLFFYPLDFTFVCPSEIIAFDKAVAKFKAKNTEVIGVSVDSHFTHLAWKNTPRNQGGIGAGSIPAGRRPGQDDFPEIRRPLEAGIALRGLFLIDTKGVVRHALVNDLPLGRNVDEALRLVDALQFHEKHGDVCPANWREGEEAMKPSAKGVAEYLAKHAT